MENFQFQNNQRVKLQTEVNGNTVKIDLQNKVTMRMVLKAVGTPHLVALLPDSRGKRKAETSGGVTKARLTGESWKYIDGRQYDRLIQNPQILKKFKQNREFLDKLVGTTSVNLLKPHLILCHVCGREIVLADSGILVDYKKHLVRHKMDKDQIIKFKAQVLLMRWAEIQSSMVEDDDLTEVPHDLVLKKKHSGMICLKTLEERIKDPSANVLRVHGQQTITAMLSRENTE